MILFRFSWGGGPKNRKLNVSKNTNYRDGSMFSGKSSATNYHDVFIWYIDRQFFFPEQFKVTPVQKNWNCTRAKKCTIPRSSKILNTSQCKNRFARANFPMPAQLKKLHVQKTKQYARIARAAVKVSDQKIINILWI